jgi:hypothetical protein
MLRVRPRSVLSDRPPLLRDLPFNCVPLAWGCLLVVACVDEPCTSIADAFETRGFDVVLQTVGFSSKVKLGIPVLYDCLTIEVPAMSVPCRQRAHIRVQLSEIFGHLLDRFCSALRASKESLAYETLHKPEQNDFDKIVTTLRTSPGGKKLNPVLNSFLNFSERCRTLSDKILCGIVRPIAQLRRYQLPTADALQCVRKTVIQIRMFQ